MNKQFVVALFFLICSGCNNHESNTRATDSEDTFTKTQSLSMSNDDHVRLALTQFVSPSYFISFNYKLKKDTFRVVIENHELFRIIGENNKNYYLENMYLLIKNDSILILENENQNKELQSYMLGNDHHTSSLCFDTTTIIDFIKTHFSENGVIRQNYKTDYLLSIIDCLFRNGILIYTDDESGYLCLREMPL